MSLARSERRDAASALAFVELRLHPVWFLLPLLLWSCGEEALLLHVPMS